MLGLLFQHQIEGTLLAIADAAGAKKRRLTSLTYGHGLIYGGAQAFELVPGVSRSGGTITAGLFLGYERKAAARSSFLLAIPAVFGSGLYEGDPSITNPCTVQTAAYRNFSPCGKRSLPPSWRSPSGS